MMHIFREKLPPAHFRDVVLGAKRWGGTQALEGGLVDGLGGLEETLAFIREKGLQTKATTGIYGTMKEEMYRYTLGILDDHVGNLEWRERVEEGNGEREEAGLKAVEEFEGKRGSKL